jgi:hypothetical protein
MADYPKSNEVEQLQTLIGTLSPLDPEARLRLLQTVITFLNIDGVYVGSGSARQGSSPSAPSLPTQNPQTTPGGGFSNRPNISVKEFLLDKEPQTDVERAACLGYYLTHYRNTPEFKTLDISKLNTEAAQVKFSNPAFAVDNATKLGFLVPASRGMKQLGALGERYVRALPDRDAAKEIRSKIRIRKTKKGTRAKLGESLEPDEG